MPSWQASSVSVACSDNETEEREDDRPPPVNDIPKSPSRDACLAVIRVGDSSYKGQGNVSFMCRQFPFLSLDL